jgi:hypothetical protein
MKTQWLQKLCFYSRFFCLLGGLFWVLVPAAGTSWAQDKPPPPKKTGGMMGDPAGKRGLEYGFDKGFQAGKTDKDGGLKPDPARHEDYNDPEKFYRYEFGSRSHFVQGFKSGFAGGYQKAFGKEVKIKIPGEKAAVSGGSARPSGATTPASAGSDAL